MAASTQNVPQFVATLMNPGEAGTQESCPADTDGNTLIDLDDLEPFVNCLLAGTCP